VGKLGGIACAIATACAAGALYFDFPVEWLRRPLALIFSLAMLFALIFVRGRWRAADVITVGVAIVLAWWFTIKPTGDRAWGPDVAQKAWADIQGDEVTVHNVRNFEYRSETAPLGNARCPFVEPDRSGSGD
jgi:hypothetical protein